jgi:hypothetical protein
MTFIETSLYLIFLRGIAKVVGTYGNVHCVGHCCMELYALLYIFFIFFLLDLNYSFITVIKFSQFCHYSLRPKDQLLGYLQTD